MLLSGIGTPNFEETLEPAFDPDTYIYHSNINTTATHIQFMLASPTTRNISYRIDNGEFITIENPVSTNLIAIPPSAIPLGSSKTKKITIKVASLETQANQDVGGEYTITVKRPIIMFLELKLFLEGTLGPP